MYPFVESIKVANRELLNLPYHEARLNQTRLEQLGARVPICLADEIATLIPKNEGVYKCRVEYAQSIQLIEFIPYTPPIIKNLKVIHANDIDYTYKSTDRRVLQTLKEEAKGYDDILIIRNGLVTDTSFCNVAFFDGYRWITPAKPLLKGTKRQQLIDKGICVEGEIQANHIADFKIITLFNAMNEFGTILLDTDAINNQ